MKDLLLFIRQNLDIIDIIVKLKDKVNSGDEAKDLLKTKINMLIDKLSKFINANLGNSNEKIDSEQIKNLTDEQKLVFLLHSFNRAAHICENSGINTLKKSGTKLKNTYLQWEPTQSNVGYEKEVFIEIRYTDYYKYNKNKYDKITDFIITDEFIEMQNYTNSELENRENYSEIYVDEFLNYLLLLYKIKDKNKNNNKSYIKSKILKNDGKLKDKLKEVYSEFLTIFNVREENIEFLKVDFMHFKDNHFFDNLEKNQILKQLNLASSCNILCMSMKNNLIQHLVNQDIIKNTYSGWCEDNDTVKYNNSKKNDNKLLVINMPGLPQFSVHCIDRIFDSLKNFDESKFPKFNRDLFYGAEKVLVLKPLDKEIDKNQEILPNYMIGLLQMQGISNEKIQLISFAEQLKIAKANNDTKKVEKICNIINSISIDTRRDYEFIDEFINNKNKEAKIFEHCQKKEKISLEECIDFGTPESIYDKENMSDEELDNKYDEIYNKLLQITFNKEYGYIINYILKEKEIDSKNKKRIKDAYILSFNFSKIEDEKTKKAILQLFGVENVDLNNSKEYDSKFCDFFAWDEGFGIQVKKEFDEKESILKELINSSKIKLQKSFNFSKNTNNSNLNIFDQMSLAIVNLSIQNSKLEKKEKDKLMLILEHIASKEYNLNYFDYKSLILNFEHNNDTSMSANECLEALSNWYNQSSRSDEARNQSEKNKKILEKSNTEHDF